MRIEKFILGLPYPQHKVRGDVEAPDRWSEAIRSQTTDLPKITGPCRLEVQFLLPRDRFPLDYKFGTDLDNLLKRLLDALKETVLVDAPGNDAAIVELYASKRPVNPGGETGARVVFTDEPWSWALQYADR